MIVPFLQLLFKKVPMVMERPTFAYSASYVLEYLKYLLSLEINKTDQVSALIKFCLVVAVLFFLKNLFRFLAVYFLKAFEILLCETPNFLAISVCVAPCLTKSSIEFLKFSFSNKSAFS
jgi:hypothetical protein